MAELQCLECKSWDKREAVYKYKMMRLTDWRPGWGLSPRMRKFECPFCNVVAYIVMTTEKLEKLGESQFQ